MSGAETLVRRLVDRYGAGDLERVRSLLAPDLIAYVTNAQASVDRVVGREAYMRRVPDLRAAGASLEVTQAVAVDTDTVLAMVEIRAEREGSVLHNFAAFLARVAGGQITELWMVDARPAYSERFWS